MCREAELCSVVPCSVISCGIYRYYSGSLCGFSPQYQPPLPEGTTDEEEKVRCMYTVYSIYNMFV